MQSKQELEKWYEEPDKWGYFSNEYDALRLQKILFILGWGKKRYDRVLDIGCGEGFITEHLPANEIHGLDISNNALNRLPQNVTPVDKPIGKYDLVISTGTLYAQYDHEYIYKLIMESASQYVLIAGISDWLIEKNFGAEIQKLHFPYRQFTQKIALYAVETRP
jgi:trans-aconitate methyltransferase